MTYWFKRRRYGMGYTLATWQGWTVTGVMAALVVLPSFFLRQETSVAVAVGYIVWVLLVIAAFIVIALLTGPSMKWRWGKSDSDDPDRDC